MQILIIGAGRIGCAVAENLVGEANDITVVDTSRERVQELQNRLDLRAIAGDATSPKVLETAGAYDADMILAVTASDETNMVVCLLASRLFNIPTRIARVRNNELRGYSRILAEEGFQITSAIWPEAALTRTIIRLIEFPEVLQILNFAEGKASLFCVQTIAGSPLVGRPVSDLSVHLPKVPARIVSIFRRNRQLDLTADTIIESGDEVIALSAGRDIRRVISELRQHEQPIHNIVIGGDARLALQLATSLCSADSRKNYSIKIIESDPELAKKMAMEDNSSALFLEGSITDEESLENAGIRTCDVFIALSHHDETSIMGSLLAKKLGARRVIAHVSSQTFGDLMQGTQIDVTVSTSQATISDLLRHVRRGDVVSAFSLRRGLAEALEIVAHGTKKNSRIVGRQIHEIDLPEGVSIAAVIRERPDGDENDVLMANPELLIEGEDRVILFVPYKRMIPQVEKLFAVDVGFF